MKSDKNLVGGRSHTHAIKGSTGHSPNPPSHSHGTSGMSAGHTHTFGVASSGSSNFYGTRGIHYNANIVVSVDYDGKFNILKNRHGTHGEDQSLDTAIDTVSNILTTIIFKGNLDMFQEGLKTKIVKAIIETIKEERSDLFEDSVLRKS